MLIDSSEISDIGAAPKVIRLPGTLVLSPGKKPKLKKPSTVRILPKKSFSTEKAASTLTIAPTETEKKTSRKWIWIVGGIAAAGALVWFISRRKHHRPFGRRRR